jgi:hypothetical protein
MVSSARRRFLLFAVAALVPLSAARANQLIVNYNTPWHGSSYSSGLFFHQAVCSMGGKTLVGIYGQSGSLVDSVKGSKCVDLLPDGKWAGQPQTESALGNITGGSDFTLLCPANHAVVGMEGRSGEVIDALAIKCAPLSMGSDGRIVVGSATSTVGPVGGVGGAPWSEMCPAGKVAYYIDNWWGSRGDYHSMTFMVRMGCEVPKIGRYYGLESFSVSKEMLEPGESATGSFTLAGPAPYGGFQARLYQPNYIVPDSRWTASPGWDITVPAGQRTANFTVTAGSGLQPGTYLDLLPTFGTYPMQPGASIAAKRLNVTYDNAPVVQSITLNPSTIYEGQGATLTVTLNNPARANQGANVYFTKTCCASFTGPANTTIQDHLFIQPGQLSASATVTNARISNTNATAPYVGTVTAKTNELGEVGKSIQWTLIPNVIQSLAVARAKDGTFYGTVTIAAATTSGRSVSLASSHPYAVQVPSSVSVPANTTTATFPITVTDPNVAMDLSTKTPVVITATTSGYGYSVSKKTRFADGYQYP